MTDEINTVNDTAAPVNEVPTTTIDKGSCFVHLKSFSGDKEGLTYYIAEYKTLADMVTKFGEDNVLAMANSFLATSMRGAANNSLQGGDTKEEALAEIAKLKAEGKTCLLTEDEAVNYVPGREREPSTSKGFMKLAQQAKKDGDTKLALAYMKRASQLLEAEMLALDNI